MKLTLDCPHAEYREEMRIYCKEARAPCAHVYYKQCKGWWVLSDGAKRCPLRGGDKNGQEHEATASGRDAV